MPYDEKGRFWPEKRNGVFSNKEMSYKPPPDYDDDPPPLMGASQEVIDRWDKEHNMGGN